MYCRKRCPRTGSNPLLLPQFIPLISAVDLPAIRTIPRSRYLRRYPCAVDLRRPRLGVRNSRVPDFHWATPRVAHVLPATRCPSSCFAPSSAACLRFPEDAALSPRAALPHGALISRRYRESPRSVRANRVPIDPVPKLLTYCWLF